MLWHCLLPFLSRFGKVEGVKVLPQRYPNIGVAAFIDFHDVKSAIEAKDAKLRIGNCELRTNFKFERQSQMLPKWLEGPIAEKPLKPEKQEKSEKARAHERYRESSLLHSFIGKYFCCFVLSVLISAHQYNRWALIGIAYSLIVVGTN